MRRFLINSGKPRPTLKDMIAGPIAGPFGVLIVGSNPGDLPQVREEIEEVQGLFINLYRDLGWPEEKVTLTRLC